MKSFEQLSEFIIEVLKEFSIQKRKLTVESLSSALSEKNELISGLSGNHEGPAQTPKSNPKPSLARVPLKKSESPEQSERLLPPLRDIYLGIIAEMEPISKGMHAQSLDALRERLQKCRTTEELIAGGNELVGMTKVHIGRVVNEAQYAVDFLSDLGKDLVGMEQQLFSYQNHNRETYLLNDKFSSDLLSQTEEMNREVEERGFEYSLIASKLAAIGKAIALKRRQDKDRLREADSKIAELQKTVRTYSNEVNEVTERANALEKEALIDALTQIHNRRAYDLEIRDTLRRFHRDGQPFSLVVMDVDKFKNVNDMFGHRAGDKCLEEIAKIVKSCLRKADFVARYGGEELVAILHGTSGDEAHYIAEKLRFRIEQTRFYYTDKEIPVTISIGVTEALPTDKDWDTPFVRADQALYRAKREGRNRVCSA